MGRVSTDIDVARLTDERFRTMSGALVGRGPLPDVHGLPAGPRWPALVQTVALLRFRHTLVPWLHRRYGDTFTLRLYPGGRPLVLFSRPEHTKEIFAGDPAVFHAGKGNAVLGPVMGEHSLLLVDGEDHRRARALLMPAFNGRALRGYADLVREISEAEVAGWPAEGRVEAHERMNALTLEVILRVVFGVTDESRLAALRPVVRRTVDISPSTLVGWQFPWLRRLGRWRRAHETQYELDRLILAEIRERRAVHDLDERTDVLSRLMRASDDDGDWLSDAELRDQLVTLLLAGHETTATALAWALHEIGRDPAQLARAREAVDTGDDAWLEAVVKESMRLHPVIPMVVRTLQAPASVGGIDFPAGVTVGPSIIITHARSDLHPDPEVFRPERFVGGNPPTNSWIPFGGGVRRCIGAGFSLMEGVAALKAVLEAYDVVGADPDSTKVRNITSIPRRGAVIRVHRR